VQTQFEGHGSEFGGVNDKHWGDEDGLIIVDVDVASFFLSFVMDPEADFLIKIPAQNM
jgi:hypothetical protein